MLSCLLLVSEPSPLAPSSRVLPVQSLLFTACSPGPLWLGGDTHAPIHLAFVPCHLGDRTVGSQSNSAMNYHGQVKGKGFQGSHQGP